MMVTILAIAVVAIIVFLYYTHSKGYVVKDNKKDKSILCTPQCPHSKDKYIHVGNACVKYDIDNRCNNKDCGYEYLYEKYSNDAIKKSIKSIKMDKTDKKVSLSEALSDHIKTITNDEMSLCGASTDNLYDILGVPGRQTIEPNESLSDAYTKSTPAYDVPVSGEIAECGLIDESDEQEKENELDDDISDDESQHE